MILDELKKLVALYLTKTNGQYIEKIRQFFLTNIGVIEGYEENLLYFRENAVKKKDNLGIGLSYGIEFWITYNQDIEKAKTINDIALSYYQKEFNYQRKAGYLSIINNYVIYYNAIGNAKESYKYIQHGIEISKAKKDFSYIYAFSNNLIYLLIDLKLYEEAYRNVLDVLAFKKFLSPLNYLVTLKILVDVLILLENYSEAEKYLNELLELNENSKIFDQVLFYKFRLEIAVFRKDVDVNEIYKKLMSMYDEANDSSDMLYVVYAIALYHLSKNDTLKASKYINKLERAKNSPTGYKSRIIDLEIQYYKLINNCEKEAKYLREQVELLNNSFSISNEISKTMVEAIRLSSYAHQEIYKKTEFAANLGKSLTLISDFTSMHTYISKGIKKIFSNVSATMIVNNNGKFKYLTERGSILIENNDEVILAASKTNQAFKLNDDFFIKYNIKNDYSGAYAVPCKGEGNNMLGISILLTNDVIEEIKFLESFYKLIEIYLYAAIDRVNKYELAVNSYAIDSLTGTLNRYGFEKTINEITESHQGYYLGILDIDDFKKINDTYGHPVGDLVLKDLSKSLVSIFNHKYVSRIGGEEFMFVVPYGVMVEEELKELISKIMNTEIETEYGSVKYSVSIGVFYSNISSDFTYLYKMADKLLYSVKENGKNNYKICIE